MKIFIQGCIFILISWSVLSEPEYEGYGFLYAPGMTPKQVGRAEIADREILNAKDKTVFPSKTARHDDSAYVGKKISKPDTLHGNLLKAPLAAVCDKEVSRPDRGSHFRNIYSAKTGRNKDRYWQTSERTDPSSRWTAQVRKSNKSHELPVVKESKFPVRNRYGIKGYENRVTDAARKDILAAHKRMRPVVALNPTAMTQEDILTSPLNNWSPSVQLSHDKAKVDEIIHPKGSRRNHDESLQTAFDGYDTALTRDRALKRNENDRSVEEGRRKGMIERTDFELAKQLQDKYDQEASDHNLALSLQRDEENTCQKRLGYRANFRASNKRQMQEDEALARQFQDEEIERQKKSLGTPAPDSWMKVIPALGRIIAVH